MRKLVISGINLFSGGMLSIYRDCLNFLIEQGYDKKFEITAFVHRKDLYKDIIGNILFIELPKSRKSYLFRLWYEYIYFYFYSRNREIDIWFSIHDITPNVKAKYIYTYCHNPAPFYDLGFNITKHDMSLFLFSKFYKYLYKINIQKADKIIVQQEWIRQEFKKIIPMEKIIVSYPNIKHEFVKRNKKFFSNNFIFIYPSVPRVAKNFDVVCEASRILEERGYSFQVLLTINGNENKYAKKLYRKYKTCDSIIWTGYLPREELYNYYNDSDCLIFASLLETWGLPITEFKITEKPIILADLPYAYESAGNYHSVVFCDMERPDILADVMQNIIRQENIYSMNNKFQKPLDIIESWKELFTILLD